MDRVVGTPVALRHVEAGALRSGIELSAAPRPLPFSSGRQPRWKMKTLSGDSAKMPPVEPQVWPAGQTVDSCGQFATSS